MRRLISSALVLLCFALAPAVAEAGQILLNGSFELGSPPPNSGNEDFDLPPGWTGVTGWLVTGYGTDLLGPPWAVSDGLRAIDLDGRRPGGIQQIFGTVPGESYDVWFDLAGNPAGLPTIKGLRVTVDSFWEDYTFDVSGKSQLDLGWTTHTFSFTASGASATLSFASRSTDPNAYGAFIDNVRVYGEPGEPVPPVASVPDPGSSLLLLGMGVVGLRACRKWRH